MATDRELCDLAASPGAGVGQRESNRNFRILSSDVGRNVELCIGEAGVAQVLTERVERSFLRRLT